MGLDVSVRNAFLDHFFGKSSYTPPVNIYVALIKTNGLEPAGDSYARVETSSVDWSAANDGVTVNDTDIVFPAPSDTWGAISHVKLFDAAAGGNELGIAALPYVRDVTSITPAPEFKAGDLRILIT